MANISSWTGDACVVELSFMETGDQLTIVELPRAGQLLKSFQKEVANFLRFFGKGQIYFYFSHLAKAYVANNVINSQ